MPKSQAIEPKPWSASDFNDINTHTYMLMCVCATLYSKP